jgi:prepilin-type N-terminal cleavage/methylation domain-containing protein
MTKPWRVSPRRGWTLIELVMVIALTSALMTVAVALLHGVVVWGDRAEKSSMRAASFHQLEFALRQELRQATAVTANGALFTITTDGGHVEFRLQGDYCLRSAPDSDPPQFERYTLGQRELWQVKSEDDVVDIRLDVPDGERGAPFHVVAAIKGDQL